MFKDQTNRSVTVMITTQIISSTAQWKQLQKWWHDQYLNQGCHGHKAT